MSKIIWFLSFSVWLILLSMIFSRSTHVVANGSISSFLMAEVVLHCVYFMYQIFSSDHIHLSRCLYSQMKRKRRRGRRRGRRRQEGGGEEGEEKEKEEEREEKDEEGEEWKKKKTTTDIVLSLHLPLWRAGIQPVSSFPMPSTAAWKLESIFETEATFRTAIN